MIDVYWPGLTRLYDSEVQAGAVLLTKEQAHALVVAAEGGLRECGYEPAFDARVRTAIRVLCFTFGLEDSDG